MTMRRRSELAVATLRSLNFLRSAPCAGDWIELTDAIAGLWLERTDDDRPWIKCVDDTQPVSNSAGLRPKKRVFRADPSPRRLADFGGDEGDRPRRVVEGPVLPVRGCAFRGTPDGVRGPDYRRPIGKLDDESSREAGRIQCDWRFQILGANCDHIPAWLKRGSNFDSGR